MAKCLYVKVQGAESKLIRAQSSVADTFVLFNMGRQASGVPE